LVNAGSFGKRFVLEVNYVKIFTNCTFSYRGGASLWGSGPDLWRASQRQDW